VSIKTKALDEGSLTTVSNVFKSLASIPDIEGVTISGGEPLLQINALYELLGLIRAGTKLGVILYTGYYLNELYKMNNKKVNEIITKQTDVIIDGPYVDELNDEKGLRGSCNQTVHFLSDRYKNNRDYFSEGPRRAEIRASESELFFIGVPDRNTLVSWKEMAENLDTLFANVE